MASDFAQSVKQQADIVKIIGDYVRLKKSGAQNYSGLCPFHSEKSPSFSVHVTGQYFYCFGCQEKGDVFSFLQKIENLSFPEAVRAVAQKCGIALPKHDFNSPEEAHESRQRGRLFDLHEAAANWFQEQLKSPEGAGAREYLTGRGVTADAIAKFRIGYAPDSYTALRDRLSPGVDAEILRASGLFSWKEQEDGSSGNLYSKFRKRITFPIANQSGKVIAFTARALDSAATAGEKAGPKYLNSPETPLYSKGRVLFNLDKAKATIKDQNAVILVEGQMDCITVFTVGNVHSVLATSGTAFTEAQVGLLKGFHNPKERLAPLRVYLSFDPDGAGASATEKSIRLFLAEGFTVMRIALDDGLDPDRYIRERGAAAYHAAIRSAQNFLDYSIERAFQLFPGRSPTAKRNQSDFLLEYARLLPDPIAKAEYISDIAQKLNVSPEILFQELKSTPAKRRDSISSTRMGLTRSQLALVRALMGSPKDPVRLAADRALDTHPEIFEHLGIAQILGALRARGNLDPLEALPTDQDRQLIAKLLFADSSPVTEEDVEEAVETEHHHYLSRRLRELQTLLLEAVRREDSAQIAAIGQERLSLDSQLRRRGY
jgi:DNA primase